MKDRGKGACFKQIYSAHSGIFSLILIFFSFIGFFYPLIHNIDENFSGNFQQSNPPFPRCAATVNAYALVVGINDYPGTELDLSYCVADANSFDSMLQGLGFPTANIEKLTVRCQVNLSI